MSDWLPEVKGILPKRPKRRWWAVAARPTSAGLPLDLVKWTPAMAAWSLRKMTYAYAGAAVNIRRSNDNAVQDIGFTPSGDFDVAGFNAFVGVNQGFVVTWYDQSGNGRNATQATAARQPQLIASLPALNGRASILWGDNTAINLACAAGAMSGLFNGGQFGMISSVCNVNVFPPVGNARLFSEGITAPNILGFFLNAGGNQMNAGWSGSTGTLARWQTVPSAFSGVGPHTIDIQYHWVLASENASVWYDGAASPVLINVPTAGAPGSDAGLIYMIGSNNGALGWAGHISEQICWQMTPGDWMSTVHLNQKAYWGTP